MPDWLRAWCQSFWSGQGTLCVLTGAGISSESGIPTFRGQDGFWTRGSVNYTPEEMATHAMLRRDPEFFWKWYLSRFACCVRAEPNAGHLALTEIQDLLGQRFILITQNIDGLHQRAGIPPEGHFRVHGDMFSLRCSKACSPEVWPLPEPLRVGLNAIAFQPETFFPQLRCPQCQEWARPHVLLFDEFYDEAWYRFQSSLMAIQIAHTLLSVGTTGATQLPSLILEKAVRRKIPLIDINTESNVFAEAAERSRGGGVLVGKSGDWLPKLLAALKATASES
jgi:NAD-dependent deacetylase